MYRYSLLSLLLYNADSPFVMSAGITVVEKLYVHCVDYPMNTLTLSNLSSNERVVDSWNSVPHDIKKSVPVNAFKNAYRRHRNAMLAPA